MDQQIVGAILRSSDDVIECYENDRDIDEAIKTFPVIDKTVVSNLASSLADLLTYKVSKEAYQRYSVRLQIIENLREWIRLPSGLDAHQMFLQNENVSGFVRTIVKKHLKKKNFPTSNIVDDKIFTLGKSLINLAQSNPFYIPHLKKLLEKIVEFNLPCEDDFLNNLLNNQEKLQLKFSDLEKLYISNTKKFIECPLIDYFILNLNNLKEKKKLSTSTEFETLCKLISASPKIFSITSRILCKLFLQLDHSFMVVEYTQFLLKKLQDILNNDRKQLINLYPINLQSCAILIKIDPELHTKNSRNYSLETLKDIYIKNDEEALSLLLHFPKWANEFHSYVNDDMI